jgi:hypothetical protein
LFKFQNSFKIDFFSRSKIRTNSFLKRKIKQRTEKRKEKIKKIKKRKGKEKEKKQGKSPNRASPHHAGVCGAVQVPTWLAYRNSHLLGCLKCFILFQRISVHY